MGFYQRFGRFKVLASTVLKLSSIKKFDQAQWFVLYKDKKHKQKDGVIKLTFESPGNFKQSSPIHSSVDQAEISSGEAVCSDYLIKLVDDLRAQLDERDQRIKNMQAYIDRVLTRVLEHCPLILENKRSI